MFRAKLLHRRRRPCSRKYCRRRSESSDAVHSATQRLTADRAWRLAHRAVLQLSVVSVLVICLSTSQRLAVLETVVDVTWTVDRLCRYEWDPWYDAACFQRIRRKRFVPRYSVQWCCERRTSCRCSDLGQDLGSSAALWALHFHIRSVRRQSIKVEKVQVFYQIDCLLIDFRDTVDTETRHNITGEHMEDAVVHPVNHLVTRAQNRSRRYPRHISEVWRQVSVHEVYCSTVRRQTSDGSWIRCRHSPTARESVCRRSAAAASQRDICNLAAIYIIKMLAKTREAFCCRA